MDEGNKISKPRISVIIPCYNEAKFIRGAIESVVNQTYQNWELFIVDDGSTDNSKEIVQRYLTDRRIKLIEHKCNKGISKAKNTGIEVARGEYIAFLDADDIWMPSKLELQLNRFQTNGKSIGIVCTGMIFTNYDMKITDVFLGFNDTNQKELLKNLYFTPTNSSSLMMIKKGTLLQVGTFDESIVGWDDYELLMRIATQFQVKYVRKLLVRKMEHPKSVHRKNMHNAPGVRAEEERVFKHILTLHPFLKNYVKVKEAISLYGEALELLERGEQASARERLRRSVKSNPWCFKAFSLYVLSFLPGQASLRVKAVISTIINRALLLVIFIRIWARKISKI